MNMSAAIASQLNLKESSVANVLGFFEEGKTIPFIARYRKEMIRGIDEISLRHVADLQNKLTQLSDARTKILGALAEKKKLTPLLEQQIIEATTLAALEEIYRPYKSNRQTKVDLAREAGLGQLANLLVARTRLDSADKLARKFINPRHGIKTEEQAIEGALIILAEDFSSTQDVRNQVKHTADAWTFVTKKKRGYAGDDRRFEDFYDKRIRWSHLVGHRLLATLRGDKAGVLSWKFETDMVPLYRLVARRVLATSDLLAFPDVKKAIELCFSKHLLPSLSRELVKEKQEAAQDSAVQVFGQNLRDLLLAAPAGAKNVLGLDPGFRAGCKAAVINQSGEVVDTFVIFPTPPKSDLEGAQKRIAQSLQAHQVHLIALGNGQGSRETLSFLRDFVLEKTDAQVVRVSEAGASVYSASPKAVEELPHLDISLRGAVSIARRLQDPLSELVKIEPASLGVGQYQHDIEERKLTTALDGVVESSVNHVGVNLNRASAELLTHVAGLDRRTAKAIMSHRQKFGAFRSRCELQKVRGIGEISFEQAAGFLRIEGGQEQLDATGIHPESYKHARRVLSVLGLKVEECPGRELKESDKLVSAMAEAGCGPETLRDILSELKAPAQDPRSEFSVPAFDPNIREIKDLAPGMELSGVVGNVTEFGAFIDLGIDVDGLLHISELNQNNQAPTHSRLTLGQTIHVRVKAVEIERKRISLSI